MGALVNASTLLHDPVWEGIVTAAALYVAREVLAEPSSTENAEVRKALAMQTIASHQQTAAYLVILVGTDPDIALTFSSANIATVGDALVIGKVTDLWTPLARNLVAS